MKTAVYLYCLVRAPQKPSVQRVPPGLTGMKDPRVLDAGDSLWLIAGDAPLSRYGKEPIEKGLQDLDWVASCAMAHEHVVDHFCRAAADNSVVIPMKLFTLFTSDERALAHIAESRKELNRAIERVAGCQEWGVRISFNRAKAAVAAQQGALRSSGKVPKGTQFLLQKKKEKDLNREFREKASAAAEEACETLSRHGKDMRRLPIMKGESGTPVVLDAAFLIPVKKVSRFQSDAKRLSTRLSKTLDLTLSGPWPPYNFVKS